MGKLDGSEHVLCIPVAFLEEMDDRQGFVPVRDRGTNDVLWWLTEAATFLPRTEALEHGDEGLAWRQVIPYVVLRSARCADRVFVYRRPAEGGDPRLARRLAIGIGGHVNPRDAERNPHGRIVPRTLANAVNREVAEEVGLGSGGGYIYHHRLAGLINDTGDDVGRRHLGLVYSLTADAPVRPVRLEVEEGGWHDIADLRTYPAKQWEGWSRILVPVIDRVIAPELSAV